MQTTSVHLGAFPVVFNDELKTYVISCLAVQRGIKVKIASVCHTISIRTFSQFTQQCKLKKHE